MQVLWLEKPEIHSSWVPAAGLPQQVIMEFEQGIPMETVVKTATHNRQRSSIVTIEKTDKGQFTNTKIVIIINM